MTKLVITEHFGRVSPVLDVATKAFVLNYGDGIELTRQEVALHSNNPFSRVREICALGTDTLICGAVSHQLEEALLSAEIKVFSFICGQIDEVIAAFFESRLDDPIFSMPGCCGRRLDFQHSDRPKGCRRRNRFRYRGGKSNS